LEATRDVIVHVTGKGPLPRTRLLDCVCAAKAIFERLHPRALFPREIQIVWARERVDGATVYGTFDPWTFRVGLNPGQTRDDAVGTLTHELWHHLEQINPGIDGGDERAAEAAETKYTDQVEAIAEHLLEARRA